MLLQIFFVITIIFTKGQCHNSCDPSSKWMREATLDKNGQMAIRWNFTKKDITLLMIAQTTGWVAIGFGPKARNFSDIIVGWVNDNIPNLQDRFINGSVPEPTLDKINSVELIGGSETKNTTYICFRRNLTTCDEEDYAITEGTTIITWAVGNEDPTNGNLKYQLAKKGQKYLHLLSVVYPKSSSKTYNLQARNKTVTSKEGSTVYWCTFYEAPPMIDQYYMTGFDAAISKRSMGIIHHIGTYACDAEKMADVYDSLIPEGYLCKNKSIASLLEYCKTMISVWAMGGEDQYFPPSSGTPFGNPNTKSYFRMEVHYNIQSKISDYEDDSIMKFYISKEKPKNILAILITGVQIAPLMVLPPRQKSFSTIAVCESKCLEKTMQKSGFTVIALRFHAHQKVSTFKLHIFRDGKELKPVVEDNFEFDFQGFRYLKDELKLLPTDTLVSECIYDTSTINKTTVGAEETEQEMCLIYLLYYPKLDSLIQCMSYIKPENIMNFTGIQEIGLPKGIPPCNGSDCQAPIALKIYTPPIPVIRPIKYANETIRTVLMNFTDWTPDNVQKFQRFYFEEQNPVCAGNTGVFYSKATDIVQYPSNADYYESPDPCKK